MTEMDPFSRERTAHEKRRWVRLTRACNNRCRFCLDAHIVGEKLRPDEDIRAEIEQGAADGCQRLILSGGEPTIHPAFLSMIALGRRSGYSWIQTVSNGRMFAYREFAARAVDAGLREATFSMHGHTARLHDHLVGVPGAFAQARAGMDHLAALGVVVNVDVVLCAPNIRHLPAILRFFIERGVLEFDLLWMVPFGRAWDNRAELFCDPDDVTPVLQEAIRLARSKGVVAWTNRLPAQLLEGHEDLIQDPHKLHDEVRGRRPEFDAWLQGHQPMVCRQPERCEQCFVRGYCDLLEEVIAIRERGRAPAMRLDARRGRLDRLPDGLEVDRLHLAAGDPDEAAALVRRMSPPPSRLVLELDEDTAVDPWQLDWGRGTHLERVATDCPELLDRLLERPSGAIEVVLDRRSAPWLRRRQEEIRAVAERYRCEPGAIDPMEAVVNAVVITLEAYLTLAEMDDRAVQPEEALRPLEGAAVGLINLPACLLPGARVVREPQALPGAALRAGSLPDLPVLTDHFIRHGYRVFSSRCVACPRRDACPGLPVNQARRHGLAILRPDALDKS